MALARWDPEVGMRSLSQAIDRFFEEPSYRPRWWLFPHLMDEEEIMPVDMFETDGAVVVKASIPGIKPEDIEISVTDNSLSIRGESKSEEEVKEENYFRRERRYGRFSRQIMLPGGTLGEKAEAEFKDGVLTITVPKAEEKKSKAIPVKMKK